MISFDFMLEFTFFFVTPNLEGALSFKGRGGSHGAERTSDPVNFQLPLVVTFPKRFL